tara:strand:- start:123 stop:284 length:162 start_codon:yes stop_codon:yes gene_type:complete
LLLQKLSYKTFTTANVENLGLVSVEGAEAADELGTDVRWETSFDVLVNVSLGK